VSRVASAGVSANAHYRPDIDGLRAVAVSSVLIFHAFPSRLPGGFVGVDIFFVISGFLISGIIFQGLERGNFSFVEFYSRRIRRIFPALLLVCAACLIFGWFSLMPDQFRQLGKHVVGGSLFSSNFVLLHESGYFDSDSAHKPLRHLWSLGIEEQYYLLWPALLFLCRKRASATIVLLLALALISFAFNLQLTASNRSMAYYLPLTRFWELMIGSGLAYWARANAPRAGSGGRWLSTSSQLAPHLANLKSILGVAAILLSLVVINERKAFPGWWALLVCAGAALVIDAGSQAWINRRILGSRPFVWVGLISYPMYLWHWPLISFGEIMSNKPSIAYRAAVLAATVALAWLTYSFVELPLRHGKAAPRMRRVTLRLATSMVVLGLVGGLVVNQVVRSASAGDPKIAAISAADTDWDGIANETIPGITGRSVLFFGDSHMEQYWPRLLLLSQQTNSRRTIEFRTLGGCAPILGIERRGTKCSQFVADGYARAAEPDVEIVVLAAQWSGLVHYNDYFRPGAPAAAPLDVLAPGNAWVFDQFSDSLAHLRRLGKRVVVLLSSPAGEPFDPKKMVDYRRVIPRAITVNAVARVDLTSSFSAVDARVRAAGERAGAELLDPMDWFCSGRLCPVQDSNGRPISKDGSHICASFVRLRATALDQFALVAPPSARAVP
jgi:peptidoglycan/LPS O-acetylase OafA/YrhL